MEMPRRLELGSERAHSSYLLVFKEGPSLTGILRSEATNGANADCASAGGSWAAPQVWLVVWQEKKGFIFSYVLELCLIV